MAGLVALGVVMLLAMLDYRFDNEAHRLFKIAAGIAAGLAVLILPNYSIALIPISAPYVLWMPQLRIPGLNTLNALVLGIFGLWLVRRVLQREPVARRAYLGGVLLLLTAALVLSWIRGAAFPAGFEYDLAKNGQVLFRSVLTYATYVIALLMVRSEREARWLMGAVVLGLGAEAATTIWFGAWFGPRAMGSMDQPNVLGAYLAIATTVTAAVMLGLRHWWARLLTFAVVVGAAYATVLTVSRGSLIALAAGLLIVSLRSSRLVTVAVIVALATSPAWAPENVKQRVLSTTQQSEESDETELEGSAQARVDTWNATLEIAKKHPIVGVGFNGLGYILVDTGEALGLEHTKSSTHNTFLRMLGEMGVLGLGLFLFVLWKCWALAETGIRRARNRFERQVAVGLWASVPVVAVNCWFGDRFLEFDIMCAFWIAAAIVNDNLLRAEESRR
jgi:O-antigen ligase